MPQSHIGEHILADLYEVCAFIRHEIHASKWRYNAIAARAGCCPSTVANLASGETKSPRLQTAIGILGALGFEVVVRK
jgi:transcriptional regulator with XRE-family HTH domain